MLLNEMMIPYNDVRESIGIKKFIALRLRRTVDRWAVDNTVMNKVGQDNKVIGIIIITFSHSERDAATWLENKVEIFPYKPKD